MEATLLNNLSIEWIKLDYLIEEDMSSTNQSFKDKSLTCINSSSYSIFSGDPVGTGTGAEGTATERILFVYGIGDIFGLLIYFTAFCDSSSILSRLRRVLIAGGSTNDECLDYGGEEGPKIIVDLWLLFARLISETLGGIIVG